jgi:hypothetical protein
MPRRLAVTARAPNPPFTRNPADIPLQVLRDFVRELAREHTYRELADRWGMGHEALRKFILGRTEQPHPRQREAYGACYLELHPAGYVDQTRSNDAARPLPRLKRVLPPDRAQAMEVLDRIFGLAERHPAEVPEQAAEVHAWLRTVLAAEFDAEARYTRGRRPSPGAEPPGDDTALDRP